MAIHLAACIVIGSGFDRLFTLAAAFHWGPNQGRLGEIRAQGVDLQDPEKRTYSARSALPATLTCSAGVAVASGLISRSESM